MQPSEIETLAKVFVQQGVRKIRLTGGEPLVRKDAADIIKRLAALGVQLTLTTNGTRLHEFWDVFEEAGIKDLNISLDTLRSDRFATMTRRDQFGLVKGNIDEAIRKRFYVKVNMVVIKGVNEDEVVDFVEWTTAAAVNVRFIEFMPFEGNGWNKDKVVTTEEMLYAISARFPFNKIREDAHATASEYRVPGPCGSFGFISTMSAPFCSQCNRMRLTADGKMKNCLFSQGETDLLSALRRGRRSCL